jgi:hypothetical protein
MAEKQTANEWAWQKVLRQLPIAAALEKPGWIEISAAELKRWGEREPRLMVKWDTLQERPACLVGLSASLLPIRNGHYIVFRDPDQKLFYRFQNKEPLFRPFASSLDLSAFDTYPGGALSESQALDFAYLAGIFKDFTGDPDLKLTLRGRLFSGAFQIHLPGIESPFSIEQVQLEIDAGYEGQNTLLLLEAKRGGRDAVHLRQLWYPHLAWSHRTQKKVRSVFFTYSNGKVQLDEFRFTDNFGDTEWIRTRAYALDPSPPPMVSVSKLLLETQSQVECFPVSCPIPQANDLDKWMELVLMLSAEPIGSEAIAHAFGMEPRQSDYYANAGLFLGMMNRQEGLFSLTPLGYSLAKLHRKSDRAFALFRRFACIDLLRELMEVWRTAELRVEAIPRKVWALELAKRTGLSEATAMRRTDSMARWLEWFSENLRVTP